MGRMIVWSFLFIMLTACYNKTDLDGVELPQSDRVKEQVSAVRAVYYVAEHGGEIAEADLLQHPQVMVVHQFAELQKQSNEATAIWIDKNVAGQVDNEWLHELPQRMNPIVVIGYNHSLYAFREVLAGFDMEGPSVDWSAVNVDGGFSVWQWKTYTDASKTAWQHGFDQSATVEHIMAVTDPLLAGEIPVLEDE